MKSFRSGTCAKTLLATTKSAGPDAVDDRARDVLREELIQRRDALALRGRRDVARRLDTQGRDAASRRRAGAGSRHCWRSPRRSSRSQALAPDRLVDQAAGVLDPAVAVRREVGVLGEDAGWPRGTSAAGPADIDRRSGRRAGRTSRARAVDPRSGSPRTAATSRGRRRAVRAGRRSCDTDESMRASSGSGACLTPQRIARVRPRLEAMRRQWYAGCDLIAPRDALSGDCFPFETSVLLDCERPAWHGRAWELTRGRRIEGRDQSRAVEGRTDGHLDPDAAGERSSSRRAYSLIDRRTGRVIHQDVDGLVDLETRLARIVWERQLAKADGPPATDARRSCPSCGASRIGSFRYCKSCGLDFEPTLHTEPRRAAFRLQEREPNVTAAAKPAADVRSRKPRPP